MATSWVPNPDPVMVPGETYRLRVTVRGPFNQFLVGTIRFHFYLKATLQRYEVVSVTASPPMAAAHNGQLTPWTVDMTFRPQPRVEPSQAGIDPRAMVALAGVIIASALSLYLIETKLEKLVNVVGERIIDPVVGPALSPGTLFLVFGAIVAFVLFRRG